uniref:Uncharacterized protein n=1 Tax=Anguilla anguilla TaxID=7936 RepID=A0A0E9PQR9_ANGAN
MRGSMKCVEL